MCHIVPRYTWGGYDAALCGVQGYLKMRNLNAGAVCQGAM
jgi:hypothetical protein